MNYRNFQDLSNLILSSIDKVPYDIDLVVGVPRSGLLVGNILSLIMNKPLTDLSGLAENRIIKTGSTKNLSGRKDSVYSCKKILVVEDSVSTGNSIIKCKEYINQLNLQCEILYLAAYVEPSKEKMVDIFFEIVSQPRVFEWNIFHHQGVIPHACIDFDGVLCVDPTEEENDDGPKYVEFIKNAKPKIIPTCKIGYIVTSRLEKYRELTQEWLSKHNVCYDQLIMLNATAEERKANALHSKFKADFYAKHSDAMLFIESSLVQAEQINSSTKKPVFCIENNEYINGGKLYNAKQSFKSRVRRFFKKFKICRWLYNLRKR